MLLLLQPAVTPPVGPRPVTQRQHRVDYLVYTEVAVAVVACNLLNQIYKNKNPNGTQRKNQLRVALEAVCLLFLLFD